MEHQNQTQVVNTLTNGGNQNCGVVACVSSSRLVALEIESAKITAVLVGVRVGRRLLHLFESALVYLV